MKYVLVVLIIIFSFSSIQAQKFSFGFDRVLTSTAIALGGISAGAIWSRKALAQIEVKSIIESICKKQTSQSNP